MIEICIRESACLVKTRIFAARTQASIVWFPEDICTTLQFAKIHTRMIKFHKKLFIESIPIDKINPGRIKSNSQKKNIDG